MLRFGITGRSGCGKSTVAKLFEQYGVHHVDADRVVHDLYRSGTPCVAALAAQFGQEVLLPDGGVDRKKLGAKVFADPAALQLLGATVHRFVGEEIEAIAQQQLRLGTKGLLVDAIALIEGGRNIGPTIAVTAPYDRQLSRIMQRDGLDEDAARARLDAQKPEEFFLRHADYVIVNDKDLAELERRVHCIAKNLGLTH